MKPFLHAFLALLASLPPALSQASEHLLFEETSTSPNAARILGNIQDGTPPPPAPPKPKLIVPAKDVLESEAIQQGGRTITVRKINPIALPPPPPAFEPLSPEAEAAFLEKVAEYRASHSRTKMMFISATVFRFKDSPPRTLVRCWPEGKRDKITYWSSADFSLISGIHAFADGNGTHHAMLMGWGYMDLEKLTDIRATKLQIDGINDLPTFLEGKASFEILGTPPAAEDLAPIQALHDLYNTDFSSLKSAYEGRVHARQLQEAALKANPPQPQNIVLSYWRNAPKTAPEEKGTTR